jgi:hypothetical protein
MTPARLPPRERHDTLSPVTGRSGKGTARQTIRVEESLWDRFATASENAGSDRSSVLRDFIRWYVREPRAKMPKRPEVPETEGER